MAVRGAERTKKRILEAAAEEFAAHGLAGARVDAIARRAGVNKQLLYHHFGGKEALFREILRDLVEGHREAFSVAPADPMHRMPLMFEEASKDLDWVRLLQWEALTDDPEGVVAEDDRREAIARWVEEIRKSQREGRVPEELDPDLLYVAMLALTHFPYLLPQVARQTAGSGPASPEFRRRYGEFLERLTRRIFEDGDDPS